MNTENKQLLKSFLNQAKKAIKLVFDIIKETLTSFNKSLGLEATASLAYYSLFSIFPLLLVLIAAGSHWLQEDIAQQHAVQYITEIFPISPMIIQSMITEIVDKRGAVTIISTVGLIWSSSGFFNLLVRNLNRPWLGTRSRHFLKTRAEALAIVIALGLLFLISIFATTIIDMLDKIRIPILEAFFLDAPIRKILANSIPTLLRLAMVWGLYHWVTQRRISKRTALAGAIFVTFSWRLLTNGFSWYLNSGFAHYDLIYGSLGTTISLMLWLYFSNYILLLGAHFSAVLERRTQTAKPKLKISRVSQVIQDTAD
jgi:membrane protein